MKTATVRRNAHRLSTQGCWHLQNQPTVRDTAPGSRGCLLNALTARCPSRFEHPPMGEGHWSRTGARDYNTRHEILARRRHTYLRARITSERRTGDLPTSPTHVREATSCWRKISSIRKPCPRVAGVEVCPRHQYCSRGSKTVSYQVCAESGMPSHQPVEPPIPVLFPPLLGTLTRNIPPGEGAVDPHLNF